MKNFWSLLLFISIFAGSAIAQNSPLPNIPSLKSEAEIPCKVIREINYPITKTEPYKQPLRIALLNLCPEDRGAEARPMLTFFVNGSPVMREYKVEKIFENQAEADKYAKENNIVEPKPTVENITDCQIIRRIEFPLTKRPNTKTNSKIALLNTCLNDEIAMQRPSIEVIRNGKKETRLFEVIKTFRNKKEAKKFASEKGITDVSYNK